MHNSEINYIPIVTAGGVTKTTIGEVIIMMHQHACHVKGSVIYSSEQVDNFKNFVDGDSIKVGGKQHVLSNYNCIPITINNGIHCIPLCPCSSQEW